MDDPDWANRAFYEDGEWVTWEEVDKHLRDQEWAEKYPGAKRSMIKYFEEMLSLAERYNRATGRHLSIYGDIGEVFGAISHGIRLNRIYAQGSDGRLGNDLVEIKTITPFKSRDVVQIDMTGNFSKLFVVKINTDFEISGRMMDRKDLPKRTGRYLHLHWDNLPG